MRDDLSQGTRDKGATETQGIGILERCECAHLIKGGRGVGLRIWHVMTFSLTTWLRPKTRPKLRPTPIRANPLDYRKPRLF